MRVFGKLKLYAQICNLFLARSINRMISKELKGHKGHKGHKGRMGLVAERLLELGRAISGLHKYFLADFLLGGFCYLEMR